MYKRTNTHLNLSIKPDLKEALRILAFESKQTISDFVIDMTLRGIKEFANEEEQWTE